MKILSALIIVCGLTSGMAFAGIYGTASMTSVDTLGLTVQVKNSYGFTGDLFAGLRTLTVQSFLPAAALPANAYFQGNGVYSGFCIDLYDAPFVSPTVYDVQPLNITPDPPAAVAGGMGSTKASLVAGLLANNTYTSALDAAALQVAIWEIIDEENEYPSFGYNNSSPWDVSTGDFFLTPNWGSNNSIITSANAMLGNIATSDYSRYIALSYGADGNPFKWGQGQDYVVVPVPGSLLIGLIGMGVAGIRLRKFA